MFNYHLKTDLKNSLFKIVVRLSEMWVKIITGSILAAIVVTVSLMYTLEWEETTIIEADQQEIDIETETPSTANTMPTVETFTVPLNSGSYLECTKTTSINCNSPKSRKIKTAHHPHRSKNGVLRETHVSVTISKKYNQPIVYYTYSNFLTKTVSLFALSMLFL